MVSHRPRATRARADALKLGRTAAVPAFAVLVFAVLTSGAAVGCTPPGPAPVVSQAQFDQIFPRQDGFYAYRHLLDALSFYPAFASAADDETRRREAAAFLANVDHETGGLVHIVEQNVAAYGSYCDESESYGCPAGRAAYFGRGPLQLSWNYNYYAAGGALGVDLLGDPSLVQRDATVAWKTALWFWTTQTGSATMTPHHAMTGGGGFGDTIRAINGGLECDGGNPAQVQSRVDAYLRITAILGAEPGENLRC